MQYDVHFKLYSHMSYKHTDTQMMFCSLLKINVFLISLYKSIITFFYYSSPKGLIMLKILVILLSIASHASINFHLSSWVMEVAAGRLRLHLHELFQEEDFIFPACPGSTSGPSPGWTCPKHLPPQGGILPKCTCIHNLVLLVTIHNSWP